MAAMKDQLPVSDAREAFEAAAARSSGRPL
ncbi:hypothetical protein AB4Z10_00105 [Bosea sp. RAF48]